MPVSTRIIKRRIKSVKSTRKITKAMELVAASKMRKAVEAAVGTRTYATIARDLMVNLSARARKPHPLLAVRPVKNILMVMVTSNRGLCGGFNVNIIKKSKLVIANPERFAAHEGETPALTSLVVGKKAIAYMRKRDVPLLAAFDKMSDTPSFTDALSLTRIVIDEYEKGAYDTVVLVYTDFVSAIEQKATIRQLLPITQTNVEELLNGTTGGTQNAPLAMSEYLFEPNPEKVLNTVLPRLVETQVYQALLESAASEHSSRMMAMRNASDSARDMIDDLPFTFNQARQAGITRELAEISAGAAALAQ